MNKPNIDEIKYIMNFRGQDVYGNAAAAEALLWYSSHLKSVESKNLELESENFRLKAKE